MLEDTKAPWYIDLLNVNIDNYDLETSHVLPALLRKVWEAKQARRPSVTAWGTGTARREFLDHVLFWNTRDLKRKLSDFQVYYNAERVHASLAGNTPLGVVTEERVQRADLDDLRWGSHRRGLVQLPMAA